MGREAGDGQGLGGVRRKRCSRRGWEGEKNAPGRGGMERKTLPVGYDRERERGVVLLFAAEDAAQAIKESGLGVLRCLPLCK